MNRGIKTLLKNFFITLVLFSITPVILGLLFSELTPSEILNNFYNSSDLNVSDMTFILIELMIIVLFIILIGRTYEKNVIKRNRWGNHNDILDLIMLKFSDSRRDH